MAGGHICVIGDAAHPFTPTSIQSCSKAIEDGVALATLLPLPHFDTEVRDGSKILTALRAFQRLRYQRVRSVQWLGEVTMKMWHNSDWNAVCENSGSIVFLQHDWLMKRDCEVYIRRMWRRVLAEFGGSESIPVGSLAADSDSDKFGPEE
jgi:2-polyprenyl-6-methoxyphenol hydroxylase-like FAD-dependent oxidoreductase